MNEKTSPASSQNGAQAGRFPANNDVCCIDTYKIYDSCRDQECLEDMRVLVTDVGQSILDQCMNIHIKQVKVLWIQIDTDELAFNRGFFQINIRYFFHVVLGCCMGPCSSQEINGLAIYDKTVILYGGESNVTTFQSSNHHSFCCLPNPNNMISSLPRVIVEVVDPMPLKLTVLDVGTTTSGCCPCSVDSIPEQVTNFFKGTFSETCNLKTAYITVGLFSIVRIERPSQLIIPACEFCIPEKNCSPVSPINDPCTFFRSMSFPIDEFYPASESCPLFSGTNQGGSAIDPKKLT